MLPRCQRITLVPESRGKVVHVHGVPHPVLRRHLRLPALRHRLVHDVGVHRGRQLLLSWPAAHLTAAGHLWHIGGHGRDGKFYKMGTLVHPTRPFLERT